MSFELKRATTRVELEALYRFRYSVYVEEMQRTQFHANHELKRIEDPLDDTACNLIALDHGNIVGCVRSNLSRDGGLDEYHKYLGMNKVTPGDFPNRTSVCTRLMLRPDLRNTSLLGRLFIANYIFGLDSEIRWTFLDCNDHLVDLFSRFGFRKTHIFTHPEYGSVNAMCLDLLDIEHLSNCGSIFAPILAKRINSFETMAERSGHSPSQ